MKPRKVPINPKLPRNFSNTRNEDRPASHQRWWHRPYIETQEYWEPPTQAELPPSITALDDAERAKMRASWLEAWPSGTRYDVRCLDGGAWDRPTCWGMFATLEAALACARERDPHQYDDLFSILNEQPQE